MKSDEVSQAPPEERKPAQSDLATPEEHAIATGNGGVAHRWEITVSGASAGRRGRVARCSWQHEAASQLHGWREHALHTADPLLFPRADYLAALKAATEPFCAKVCPKTQALKDTPENQDRHGTYVPHRAALSPYGANAKAKA